MDKRPFQQKDLIDYFFAFPKGVNAGIAPILLPKDQMATAVNVTCRGDFARPRPKFRKIDLEFVGYDGILNQTTFEDGRFQGAGYFRPDSGTDSLMVSISGHLFRCAITGNTAMVTDESIPGDLNGANEEIDWIIDAEKWAVVTDGVSLPIFYDGISSVRSLGNTVIAATTTTAAKFSIPPIDPTGATTVAVTLNANFTGVNGDTINFGSTSGFVVKAGAGTPNITVYNLNAHPIGAIVKAGVAATWTIAAYQLPVLRQTAYGMGRIWGSLTDGKQFLAGDLVGGSSGSVANNFRDAILNVTENNYLLGGGYFTVPGQYGAIHAFCFSETLDTSLGQGALQVYTADSVFSCNAPVDRTTWQNLTNPILTESAKNMGGLSQWSTVNGNADILSRDVIGSRSLVLSRREWNTWGNTPISREVQPQLDRDSEDLLRFSSRVEFDNRDLLTSEPVLTEERGVYWKRIVPINFDPTSSLAGKAPSIYDSLYWTGLNIFQLVKGKFVTQERCFAFTLNNHTSKIELWEILKSADPAIYDNDTTRVTWSIATFMDFGQKDPRIRDRIRLGQSEIYVDELRGQVDFQAYYRPDDWPCWVPWHAWQECASNETEGGIPTFRPNMGLPEPDPGPCDIPNNRPLREGYTFHFLLVITGQCRLKGGRFGATTVPQPEWAKPVCCPGPAQASTATGANQIPANIVVLGDAAGNVLGDGSGVILGG